MESWLIGQLHPSSTVPALSTLSHNKELGVQSHPCANQCCAKISVGDAPLAVGSRKVASHGCAA